MTPDEINELKELIEFLKENGIGEFEHLSAATTKVRIKFGHSPQGDAPSAFEYGAAGAIADSAAVIAGLAPPASAVASMLCRVRRRRDPAADA